MGTVNRKKSGSDYGNIATGQKIAKHTLEVFVDGDWQELFRSERMTGKSKSIPIRAEFPSGMQMLRLLTTDGGDGVSSDHAVWADAKFFDE